MIASRLVQCAVAAAISGAASASAPAADAFDTDVFITHVTADPPAGSGIFAFAVGVRGRLGSDERSYFIPFMDIGQAKPRAGQTCDIQWRRHSARWNWILGDGTQLFSGRLVTDFRCRDHAEAASGDARPPDGLR
jgi:hypothetical protein